MLAQQTAGRNPFSMFLADALFCQRDQLQALFLQTMQELSKYKSKRGEVAGDIIGASSSHVA